MLTSRNQSGTLTATAKRQCNSYYIVPRILIRAYRFTRVCTHIARYQRPILRRKLLELTAE